MKTNIIAIFDSHEILTKDTSCFDFVKLLITEVKTVLFLKIITIKWKVIYYKC